MSSFLERIKLKTSYEVEYPIGQEEFTALFKENVDYGDTSLQPFEALKSSENDYVGDISKYGFKLRRRRRMFDFNQNLSIVSGEFLGLTRNITIRLTINAFRKILLIPLILLLLLYAVGIVVGIIFSIREDSAIITYILPPVLIHGLLMFGIPYFLMRRSVRKMKKEIDREFTYWISKNKT